MNEGFRCLLKGLSSTHGKQVMLCAIRAYPCRAIRTQRFLDFTKLDLAQRASKQREIWEQLEAARKGKLVTKEELDAFYFRLQVGRGRRARRARRVSPTYCMWRVSRVVVFLN